MILKETILSVFNERGTLLKWLKKVEALTSDIIERAILKPTDNPQSTNLVAVDNTGAQVMLEVGTGLTIDNGVLKFANVYDGTVIIEKAESVLGLRKLKADFTPIEITDDTLTAEQLFTMYGMTIDTGDTGNGVTCIFNNAIVGLMCVARHSVDGETKYMELLDEGVDELVDAWVNDGIEIITTNNTTVNEWLLANTEGVSV